MIHERAYLIYICSQGLQMHGYVSTPPPESSSGQQLISAVLTHTRTQARLGAERSVGLYHEFDVEWICEILIPYSEYRHLDFVGPTSIGQCRSRQELDFDFGYRLVRIIHAIFDAGSDLW